MLFAHDVQHRIDVRRGACARDDPAVFDEEHVRVYRDCGSCTLGGEDVYRARVDVAEIMHRESCLMAESGIRVAGPEHAHHAPWPQPQHPPGYTAAVSN